MFFSVRKKNGIVLDKTARMRYNMQRTKTDFTVMIQKEYRSNGGIQKMKKRISILLLCAMLLAGCATEKEAENGTDTTSSDNGTVESTA